MYCCGVLCSIVLWCVFVCWSVVPVCVVLGISSRRIVLCCGVLCCDLVFVVLFGCIVLSCVVLRCGV